MEAKKLSFLILILFLYTFFFSTAGALAGEPTERVRQSADAILEVLRDQELKKPANEKARRQRIHEIVNGIFDFNEMSRRSLATRWKERTPEEQKEFVALYSELLQDTYVRKVEKNYTDEKVTYLSEKAEGDKAIVKTKIVSKKGIETPIDYRLTNKSGKWMVYDVVIEGVSLVNNYRSQFSQILTSGSWQDLVSRLKTKQLKEPA